jgi:hypothetical protein
MCIFLRNNFSELRRLGAGQVDSTAIDSIGGMPGFKMPMLRAPIRKGVVILARQ